MAEQDELKNDEVKEKKKTVSPIKKKATRKSNSKKPEKIKPIIESKSPRFEIEKKSGGKGLFLVLFIFIVLFIVAAAWFQSQKITKSDQVLTGDLDLKLNTEVNKLQEKLDNLAQELQQKLDRPQASLATHENTYIPLSFSYPEELGEIKVEI